MVKKIFILIVLCFMFSCKKDSESPTYYPSQQTTTPQLTEKGSCIFYYLSEPNLNVGSGVDIYINNIYKGKVTMFPEAIPLCETYWGYCYSDTIGVYSYSAKVTDASPASYNFTKTGTFSIITNGCSKINTHP